MTLTAIETARLQLLPYSPAQQLALLESVEAFERAMGLRAADGLRDFLRAHTLPTPNASTRVLAKCGFVHTGEVVDPEDGPVWRWERRAPS